MSSFCFNPKYHIVFSYYSSSVSSGLWQFFNLCLFFMTLMVLKITGQVSCRTSPILVFLMFFSWLYWGTGFGKECPWRQSALLITSYQEYIISMTSMGMLTFVAWLRKPLLGSSLFSPFPTFIFFFWIEAISLACLQRWGIKLHFLEGVICTYIILNSSGRKICLFSTMHLHIW